ncbi:MAG: hypothetical protein ACO3YZ_03880 [Candidatus Nanopelagicaceae bacterium]
MSEIPAKYRVKPGKVIFHGGERFEEGAELELIPAVAEVHAVNVELIEDATPPLPEEPKPPTKKKLPEPDAANGEP